MPIVRRQVWAGACAAAVLGAAVMGSAASAGAEHRGRAGEDRDASAGEPATPIGHVVVIFQENVSFDHYFGTYPRAANTDGQPFHARAGTPEPDGLQGSLLTANPNGVNPARYSPAHDDQLVTCDQGHGYTQEQEAFDGGAMDRFPLFTGNSNGTNPVTKAQCNPGDVMNYYDGNTVTALWNYAQHFAMSDASFGTTFGPSTPGALNLVSGNTHGVDPTTERGNLAGELSTDGQTVIGDPQPALDDCSTRDAVSITQDGGHGRNIGDLLNGAGLTWGFFQGGFAPTTPYAGPGTKAVCNGPAATHNVGAALGGTGSSGTKPYGTKGDYIAHHQPFQYFASTSNPHHLPPSSASAIGTTDQASHQYDLSDFTAALKAGHLPAVSFLKAAGYQDGHAGYSDPIDEQQFLVGVLNALQRSDAWRHTAVFIAYDDSDGWYDHRHASPLVANPSSDAVFDALTGPGTCGSGLSLGGYSARCGHGPRLPLLVISPFARADFVGHTQTDQTSILRFVEDNWGLGRIGDGSFDALAGGVGGLFDFEQRPLHALLLDPVTGQPAR